MLPQILAPFGNFPKDFPIPDSYCGAPSNEAPAIIPLFQLKRKAPLEIRAVMPDPEHGPVEAARHHQPGHHTLEVTVLE
jgi:hypothetical protein